MCTGREVELSLTEAERVVIVRDLSLAISSALTVETEMITTFTDSERHRQDPSTDALQTAAWPHDGQENPRIGPGTQALLGGHEPGRRSILRDAARLASPIRKSKNQSRSFGKEPEVLPRTRLSTKVSIETTRRVLLCHSSPPL